MNRHITIEWPYDQITLEFKPETLRKPAAPLRSDQWDALEKAERRVYHGDPGCHGWTDAMCNDGDEFLNSLWSHAADYSANQADCEQSWDGKEVQRERYIMHMTARRVAQSLAVMAFGAEILIAG